MNRIVLALDFLLIAVIFTVALLTVNKRAVYFAAAEEPETEEMPVIFVSEPEPEPPEPLIIEAVETVYLAEQPIAEPPIETPLIYPQPSYHVPYEEIKAVARTIAGECFDDKPDDKRRVAEVIVNRVSDGRFGDSVIKVIKSPGQFYGYWKQNRPVSVNDVQIAENVLYDWYARDCKRMSEYLYFCAGANKENKFRTEF